MRALRCSWLVFLPLLLSSGCGPKGGWLVGQWLLLDQDGKPGVCHEFVKDGNLVVYTSAECGGEKDQVSSGRWEVKEESKDETRLAIIRYNERKGQMVVITDKGEASFVCRQAIAGTMFRVGPKGSSEVLAEIERKGLIKVKALDPALGCRQLALPIKDIRALPPATVEHVRMLRAKDQMLKFHQNKNSADPRVDKVIYALNDESLEWMALHLAESVFNPPGPQALLEGIIGKPADQTATGSGEKRQHIIMWRSYCALTKDAPKREIDVTLFSTAGDKRATVYVSDNVVSGLWEELKQAAQDTARQAGPEDEEEGEGEKGKGGAAKPAEPEAGKAAAPAKAEAPAKAAPAAPAVAEPKAGKGKAGGKKGPAKKGQASDDDDDI